MVTIEDVRRFALTLPRTTEALVRGRLIAATSALPYALPYATRKDGHWIHNVYLRTHHPPAGRPCPGASATIDPPTIPPCPNESTKP